MTPAATALLAASVTLGVLAALAIPQNPPDSSAGRARGSGTANGATGASRVPSGSYGAFSGLATVVDGDGLRVNGAVRLWGIDAPERAQTCTDASRRSYACGEASAAHLRRLVERDPAVDCARRDADRYGRTVAVCVNSAGDLGRRQVIAGWAVDYARYSGGRYRDEEEAAKAGRLGLWSGEFQQPEQWRKENPTR